MQAVLLALGEDTMTFPEFVNQCQQNADAIYVRAQVDGKWQSVELSKLPEEDAMVHIKRWWTEREAK